MSVVSQESPVVEIRSFEDDWIEPCISIYINAFSQPPWSESWTPKFVLKRLQGILDRKDFTGFIALVDSNPVGFLLGHRLSIYPFKNYFHIRELLVVTQYRGLGIGKKLMASLMENLREININKISLFTRKESQAERFFMKTGFTKRIWGFSTNKLVWMTYSFSTINTW